MARTPQQNKHYKENRVRILEERKEHDRKYRQKNKEKITEYTKQYQKTYFKKRASVDLVYRIKCNLRKRLWDALKGLSKTVRTVTLLGCTVEQLVAHLETQFLPGMTWENYGQWHIDHIIPCASFNLAIEEEQKKCFNYSNLQPLWAIDNLKKSNKILYATASNNQARA